MSNHELISIRDVCVRTTLSRTQINVLRDRNQFPQAVSLGDKRIAFVTREVDEWVAQRVAARGKVKAEA